MNSHRLNKIKGGLRCLVEKDLLQAGLRRKYRWNYKVIMWNMIDTMDEPRDYLQVFDLSEENGKQKDCSFTRTTGIHEGVSV